MLSPKRIAFFIAAAAILALVTHASRARSQQSQYPQPVPKQQTQRTMPCMDMGDAHSEATQSAHDAMSDEHMDMGPHMYMTALRTENPADEKRAAALVVTLREAIVKYKDYKLVLADGFQIFHPEVPQPHYHFTNYRYAFGPPSISTPLIPRRCDTKKPPTATN